MNNSKNKGDSSIHNTHLDQKYFLPRSPVEENRLLLKQRYVSCSSSVPRRSKHFVQYRLSRSLNSVTHTHNSSSENSSFEEDKHMSRSAKIMRALNFNSSPSYYGKTKIKKSFNFNSTPSPKRFTPVRKGIRKSLNLSFSSPLSVSNKVLDFDNDASDCANNSSIFTSPESMDENQNETPSQQSTKKHKRLHYSTPNTKLSRKSSASFTPLLRSRLKETIDNIVYITATPNSHSLKYVRGKSKCTDNVMTNTSRNLFHEFHDKDDDRPHTPENFVRIVPESMSAIKRSHKKERSRRTQLTNSFANDMDEFQNEGECILNAHTDPLDDSDYTDQYCDKNLSSNEIPLCNSEDDISETGSLFDYMEEQKNIVLKVEKVSDSATNCDNVQSKFHEYNVETKLEGSVESLLETQTLNHNEIEQEEINVKTEDLFVQENDLKTEVRSVTPESTSEAILESQKSVTPENHINVLQIVANDSIKKSRKKNKDDNKRKLFSPRVLPYKLEVVEQRDTECQQNLEQTESAEENKVADEQNHLERAGTPEKVNSSRLLLSQFSSVKKSHKKDKHNKILSGFLRRQEYFNKEINLVNDIKPEVYNADDIEYRKSTEDLSSELNTTTNFDDSICSMSRTDENTSNKLSPSKRKIASDMSLEHDTSNVSCNSELNECDSSKEEFKIFTPLKRKRKSLTASVRKEHLHFYNLPSGKEEISEEAIGNISLSRCLTPVRNFQDNYMKLDEHRLDDSDNIVSSEILDCSSNDITGRSTPRNMSTVELYSNLDSIKKSHKKNKRGYCSRKNFNLSNNVRDENDQTSSESIENMTYDESELSTNCIAANDVSKLGTDEIINYGNVEGCSNSHVDDENLRNMNTENVLHNITPPNSLKTKNYIKLLRETSIKRSHKKVRDQKKHESTSEANELSDDGSIFGDEEKLTDTEDQAIKK